MSKNEINLLVGGPSENWPANLLEERKNEIWAGADQGAWHLVAHGIKPLLSIGDFDSSTAQQKQLIFANSQQVITDQPEKDDTDTELALRHLLNDYQATRINIFGATGGRIDHLLANLFFVLRPEFLKFADRFFIYDRQNDISFFTPGSYTISQHPDRKYLAFVLLTAVENLTLFDEKYQLNKRSFAHPISLASNEFVKKAAAFSFTSGVISVIQSRD